MSARINRATTSEVGERGWQIGSPGQVGMAHDRMGLGRFVPFMWFARASTRPGRSSQNGGKAEVTGPWGRFPRRASLSANFNRFGSRGDVAPLYVHHSVFRRRSIRLSTDSTSATFASSSGLPILRRLSSSACFAATRLTKEHSDRPGDPRRASMQIPPGSQFLRCQLHRFESQWRQAPLCVHSVSCRSTNSREESA